MECVTLDKGRIECLMNELRSLIDTSEKTATEVRVTLTVDQKVGCIKLRPEVEPIVIDV